jgi:hypothetical protein
MKRPAAYATPSTSSACPSVPKVATSAHSSNGIGVDGGSGEVVASALPDGARPDAAAEGGSVGDAPDERASAPALEEAYPDGRREETPIATPRIVTAANAPARVSVERLDTAGVAAVGRSAPVIAR